MPVKRDADRQGSRGDATPSTPPSVSSIDLFRALPGDLAARDAQDLMAYPFFSLAKSKRIVPSISAPARSVIRVEAVPEHGMATIWTPTS